MDDKEVYQNFINLCKSFKAKNTKLDEEGVPTLYSGSKRKPWNCKPWGENTAALTIIQENTTENNDTIHGKTMKSIIKKFEKYIGFDNTKKIIGDNEAIFVFPMDKLQKVIRHFSFKQKKFTEAQLKHQEKFGKNRKKPDVEN